MEQVASGAVGFVGLMLVRAGPFGPPIIAHSFGLLVGIVMLLRRVPSVDSLPWDQSGAPVRLDQNTLIQELLPGSP